MTTIDSERQLPLFNAVYGQFILTFGRGERWEDWEQDGCFENREACFLQYCPSVAILGCGRPIVGGESMTSRKTQVRDIDLARPEWAAVKELDETADWLIDLPLATVKCYAGR